MGLNAESGRDIVVIGASAGGVNALIDLVKQFDAGFNGSIFIVQHVAPFNTSILPQLLSSAGMLPASHARDGERIEKGRIYVAPPNFHLLLDKEHVLVKKGPKENRFRPSIDALFRSAAYIHRSRVVSIVLSGMLDDGTAGMWAVKRLGGYCIVQDPAEAICPAMPGSVLDHVDVDRVMPVSAMGELLKQLSQEHIEPEPGLSSNEAERIATEVSIAAEENGFEMGILDMAKPTHYTCPECSGSLVEISEGSIKRYRCHTGHAFSQEALLAGAAKSVEDSMWHTIRGLEEVIMLLEESAKQFREAGNPFKAQAFEKNSRDLRQRSNEIRQLIFELNRFGENQDERKKVG